MFSIFFLFLLKMLFVLFLWMKKEEEFVLPVPQTMILVKCRFKGGMKQKRRLRNSIRDCPKVLFQMVLLLHIFFIDTHPLILKFCWN